MCISVSLSAWDVGERFSWWGSRDRSSQLGKEKQNRSICYGCGESFCSLLSCLAKCWMVDRFAAVCGNLREERMSVGIKSMNECWVQCCCVVLLIQLSVWYQENPWGWVYANPFAIFSALERMHRTPPCLEKPGIIWSLPSRFLSCLSFWPNLNMKAVMNASASHYYYICM